MSGFDEKVFDYKDHRFEMVINHDWIDDACNLAIAKIRARRSFTKILFVSMLDRSVPFQEELMKKASWDMDIMHISYHSYEDQHGIGNFKITKPIDNERVKGRDVIILEGIVDTGLTMQKVIADLKEAGARSVKIVCVLDKVGKHPDLPILFACFKIMDRFVVGYGMDYDGKFSNLKHIYAVGLSSEDNLVLD